MVLWPSLGMANTEKNLIFCHQTAITVLSVHPRSFWLFAFEASWVWVRKGCKRDIWRETFLYIKFKYFVKTSQNFSQYISVVWFTQSFWLNQRILHPYVGDIKFIDQYFACKSNLAKIKFWLMLSNKTASE